MTKQKKCAFATKKTPDIPPITINDIQIEQVHSTRLLVVTISQDLTWQLHIDDITTTTLHHSTQACWNRTASSRQNIYHNHTLCHRIRLLSVA